MRIRQMLPVLLLALATACAPTFRADVARFKMMPPPSGQTFTVKASDPAKDGSLEFRTYAAIVSQQLAAQGYVPATGGTPTLTVSVDYGVDNGREKIATRPGSWAPGFGHGWYGYPVGFPLHYRGRPAYWGAFYDPFWGSPFDRGEVYSYTVYNSFVDVRINRAGTSESVFEGRAESRSSSDDLTRLVPNLVTALFKDFPGRSGEKVRVTVQPPKA
jgi:Domain of unknown function (DUF4136)